jgi:hypothetical protein
MFKSRKLAIAEKEKKFIILWTSPFSLIGPYSPNPSVKG